MRAAADAAELKSYFEFQATNRIYAVIGQQVCKWDGSQWSTVTDVVPAGLAPYFQLMDEELIYGIGGVDGLVYRWE